MCVRTLARQASVETTLWDVDIYLIATGNGTPLWDLDILLLAYIMYHVITQRTFISIHESFV